MRLFHASNATAALVLALLGSANALTLPGRREAIQQFLSTYVTSAVLGGMILTNNPSRNWASTDQSTEEESMFAPKFVQEYADFVKTNEGWSYRDVSVGNGASPNVGDRVVFDWSGYTIGYFGRPFEAKGGPQGGAFDKRDVDFSRTVLGSGEVVKGLESAMRDMKVGGVRQVIVPYGALSYPADDGSHDRVGPKPTTFSGQRALNFVLDNPRVDRTLLFNVKLIRVDKPNGKGGFSRGDRA
ncbi:FKBP-type peptidyl-prolyl cis-trans isomerase [Nitzschia inconspicua]|uniref:peptidylprolyl isomerase n=1 Tax=Nitzschia inconspicua TaxID=303405 RepID=A0A9K3LZ17_9STRA|nr:FKBP-type peptidyl-prolyl cis-trans isomerase [Nitzschia inconspicua]